MSIFVSFVAGAALFYLHRFFPFAAFGLFLLFFSLCGLSRVRRDKAGALQNNRWLRFISSLVLPLIILSLGYYQASASHIPAPDFQQLSGQVTEFRGRTISEPLPMQSGLLRFLNDMEISEASFQGSPLSITKMRLFTDQPLSQVKAYSVSAKIPGDSSFMNPGGLIGNDMLFSGYALEIQEDGNGSINRTFLERARSSLNAELMANFKGDVGAFLMSIITGERGSMSREMKNAFNVTGLAHILSISVAHFGLLLFILFKIFRLLVRLCRMPFWPGLRFMSRLRKSRHCSVCR